MILESIVLAVACAGLLYMTASAIWMVYRLCTVSQEMEDEYTDELNLDEEPH